MKNSKLVKLTVGSVFGASLICGAALLQTDNVDASTAWTANTSSSLQISQNQKEYTVKRGDTLWAISMKTNIKVQTLAKASNIENASFIQIGQTIQLNGSKMTIKSVSGKVVSQTVLKSDDKVEIDKAYGTAVKQDNASATQTATKSVNTTSTATSVASTAPASTATSTATSSAASTVPVSAATSTATSAASTTPASTTENSTGSFLTDKNDDYSFLNAEGLQQAESAVLAEINAIRQSSGSEPVAVYENIQSAADLRGQENAAHYTSTGDYDWHTRPDGTNATTAIPGSKVGEVESIAYDQYESNDPITVGTSAVDLWYTDAAHFAIITDPGWKAVGISVLPVTTPDGNKVYTVVADFAS